MGDARSVTAVLVAAAACLATALAGCGRPVKTGTGGVAGPPAVGQAHILTQAQIDAIIAPLPERDRADLAKSLPQWLTWTDRLRGVYAALPPEATQTMVSKGSYEFTLADLPEPQAKVIKDLVAEDPDRNIRDTLEQWAGKPLDLSKVSFASKRQGDKVFLAFRSGGSEFSPAPIGVWPGGEQGR